MSCESVMRAPSRFVKMGLLDESGKPNTGYPPHEADGFKGDSVAQMVSWNGNADVSADAGKPIRLRFEMMHTALFGFQFQ